MVNLPVFFTSAVASTEKSSSNFETSPFVMPLFVAKESQMAVFVRAEAAFFFMAFMVFMAFMAFFFFITLMAFMATGAAAFMARRFIAAFFLIAFMAFMATGAAAFMARRLMAAFFLIKGQRLRPADLEVLK